jgi:hypothetical protein
MSKFTFRSFGLACVGLSMIARNRRLFLLIGKPLITIGDAVDTAKAGEVALTPYAGSMIKDLVEAETHEETGCLVIKSIRCIDQMPPYIAMDVGVCSTSVFTFCLSYNVLMIFIELEFQSAQGAAGVLAYDSAGSLAGVPEGGDYQRDDASAPAVYRGPVSWSARLAVQ